MRTAMNTAGFMILWIQAVPAAVQEREAHPTPPELRIPAAAQGRETHPIFPAGEAHAVAISGTEGYKLISKCIVGGID